VLFDREHAIDLLCNTPSCVIRTEPRLKRILAKKIHRNTRTLRDGAIDITASQNIDNDDFEISYINDFTSESIFSHSTGITNDNNNLTITPNDNGNNSDNKSNTNNSNNNDAELQNSGGNNSEGVIIRSPAVLMPGAVDEAHQAQMIRVSFVNLKDSQEFREVGMENYLHKSFDDVSNNCFQSGLRNSSRLASLSKVWDFSFDDPDDAEVLPLHHHHHHHRPHSTGASNQSNTQNGKNEVKNSSIYIPPTSTLDMDFNMNGRFFVV